MGATSFEKVGAVFDAAWANADTGTASAALTASARVSARCDDDADARLPISALLVRICSPHDRGAATSDRRSHGVGDTALGRPSANRWTLNSSGERPLHGYVLLHGRP